MNPDHIAILMEAQGKHIVILKPLMSKEDPTKHRQHLNTWTATYLADDDMQVPENQRYMQNAPHRQTPEWKAAYERRMDKQRRELPPIRNQERVIEADYVAPLDDATMMVCIGPGRFVGRRGGFHSNRGKRPTALQKMRAAKDVYTSVEWNNAAQEYTVVRKFDKILTVNMDNILSIDGKPVMGSRELDRGVQHLDEQVVGEAMDQPNQPAQPKAYRIVMRARSEEDREEETEEGGYVNPLPARAATVIDADHIAPLTDEIYLVGIGAGPGEPHISRLRHPKHHADFWHPMQHRPSNPNAPCEIDDEGFHHHPGGDPHHTDYYTVPKFQKVITMHAKNIATINGKPVLYTGDSGDKGVEHLGQFDEWSINNISGLLED